MKALYTKLLKVQKKIGAISRDAENPFFKSKYFDINALIEQVKPILNDAGLVVVQPLSTLGGQPAITTLIIDTDSEEILEYSTPLPVNPDPQKMGSAITYYRRYALVSFLFLNAEDDDGNKASKPEAYKPISSPTVDEDCKKCGAPLRISKAGKPYCSKVCWKTEEEKAADRPVVEEPALTDLPF